MNISVFTEQMALLAQGCVPQNLDPVAQGLQFKFYRRFLIDLEDAEFVRAVTVYVTETQPGDAKGKFFPGVSVLRTLARPLPTDNELGPIFNRIEGMERWDPQGTYISARDVGQVLGAAAREAFVAIGGSSTFLQLDRGNNRVFAMQRFFEAYREAQKSGARNALIGPPPERVKELVGATATALAFPVKPVAPSGKDAWNRSHP